MWSALWRKLTGSLFEHALASAPAVWGKLPDHGDFVHHRASVAERRAWHHWVQTSWPPVEPTPSARARQRVSQQGWMHLSPPSLSVQKPRLPVAFVLPPGCLPFATVHMVHGVMLESQDKVGRSYPLVIYQRTTPAWMQRLWAEGGAMGGQDLLFWWARLAVRAVHAEMPWTEWLERLDAISDLYAPGMPQLLGAAPRQVPPQELRATLGRSDMADPASHCLGVQRLPWADWPERSLRPSNPLPAFWTQDDEGGYVQASDSLHTLWSHKP